MHPVNMKGLSLLSKFGSIVAVVVTIIISLLGTVFYVPPDSPLIQNESATIIGMRFTGQDADVDIEIDNSSFTLFRFGREAYLQVLLGEGQLTFKDGKVKHKKGDLNASLYMLDNMDILEFELHLDKKPKSNVLSFPIIFQGLSFHYQPPLYLDYGLAAPNATCNATACQGARRPVEVVGSYAVYYNKRDNKYKTGKAFHIYRPLVFDSNNDSAWAELSITEIGPGTGLLSVTIDEAWLNKANYPIIIDPTLGYTSAGGSGDWICDNWYYGGSSSDAMRGIQVEMTEAGIASHLNTYISSANGGDRIGDVMAWIYEANGTAPNQHSGVINKSISADATSPAWHEFDITDTEISSGTNYVLAATCDADTLTDTAFNLRYDVVGGTCYSSEDPITYPGTDPWNEVITCVGANFSYSIYANYTLADTCTPTAGANWAITISDNCSKADAQITVGNVTITGDDGVLIFNNYNLTYENWWPSCSNCLITKFQDGGLSWIQ